MPGPEEISQVRELMKSFGRDPHEHPAERLVFLTYAVTVCPGDADIWAKKAGLHHYFGQLDDAALCYSRAIEIDPRYRLYLSYAPALCFEAVGRFEEAIAHYEELKRLDRDFHKEIWMYLVVLYIQQERYQEALRHCTEALTKYSGDRRITALHHFCQSELRRQHDPPQKVLTDAEKNECETTIDFAISVIFYYQSSKIFWLIHRTRFHDLSSLMAPGMVPLLLRVIGHRRRQLIVHPGDLWLSRSLGEALTILGRKQEALACYTASLRAHPHSKDSLEYEKILREKGFIVAPNFELRLGKRSSVILNLRDIYHKILKVEQVTDQRQWGIWNLIELGQIFDEISDFVGARYFFERAYAMDTSVMAVLEGNARVHLEAGQLAEAIRWYDNCLRLDNSRTDIRNLREWVAVLLNHEPGLIKAVPRICFRKQYPYPQLAGSSLSPENKVLVFDLVRKAAGHQAEERFNEEAEVYRHLLKLVPDNIDFLLSAAEASKRAGAGGDALHWYDEIVRIEPDNRPALYGKAGVLEKLGNSGEAQEIWDLLSGKKHKVAPSIIRPDPAPASPLLAATPPSHPHISPVRPDKAPLMSSGTAVLHIKPKAIDEDTRYSLHPPEDSTALYDLERHALVLEAGGRLDEAIRVYEDQIRKNPSTIRFRISCILALIRQERYGDAIHECRDAAGHVAWEYFISDPKYYSSLTPLADLEEFCRSNLANSRDTDHHVPTGSERESEDLVLYRGFSCLLAFQSRQVYSMLDATKLKDLKSTGAREMEASFLRIFSYFDARIRRDPKDIASHIRKGLALEKLGRKSEAEACYSQARRAADRWSYEEYHEKHIATNPFTPPGIPVSVAGAPASGPDACTDPFRKGRLLALAGRREEALRCLADLVAADRQPASYWVKRGTVVKKNSRDLYGALWCFERALAIDPQCIDALLELGTYYMGNGDFVQAHLWFDRAVALCPDSREALQKKIWVYLNTERYDEVVEYYDRCIRLRTGTANDQRHRDEYAFLARRKLWPRPVLSGICMQERYPDPLKPPGFQEVPLPGAMFDVPLAVFNNHFVQCVLHLGHGEREVMNDLLMDLVSHYPDLARRYVTWSCAQSFISLKAFHLIRHIGENLQKLSGDKEPLAMIEKRIKELSTDVTPP